LIEPHVHTSDAYDLGDNIYTLIDPCNVLQSNKLHPVYLTTSAEFFEKRSPTNYLFYTKLVMPTDVNHMLENISEITSSRYLNTVHSCKFTFTFIGEHVVNIFYVHAICIMSDKLADLKSNMFCVDSCDLYFPNEMTQFFSACNSEPSMSLPCLSNSSNENTHGQKSAICAHAEQLFSSLGIDFKRHTTKSIHKSLLTVKIRQPSHEFTFRVGISFIPYPLVLTSVV
jgi:hypothetical protein